MKNILYAITLLVGFLLLASESVNATITPNMIGLAMFAYAAYKLGFFVNRRTEP